MATTTTTLAGAMGLNDTTVNVTSTTGFVAGMYLEIEGEMMQIPFGGVTSGSTIVRVARTGPGSTQSAHPISANVVVGLGSDFPQGTAGIDEPTPFPPQFSLPKYSYGAAGAILPSQGIHIINGTSALAMTLAAPTTLQDGQLLVVVGNGKAAHTLTVAGGLGAGGTALDTLTFASGGQQSIPVIAANGVWVQFQSVMAGTLTNITVTAS